MQTVTFLNPRTCGIYKSGGTRFKTDSTTGLRTKEVDNELIDCVEAFLAGGRLPGDVQVKVSHVFRNGVIVPTYYDERYNEPIHRILENP